MMIGISHIAFQALKDMGLTRQLREVRKVNETTYLVDLPQKTYDHLQFVRKDDETLDGTIRRLAGA